jgi:hypothetical protein
MEVTRRRIVGLHEEPVASTHPTRSSQRDAIQILSANGKVDDSTPPHSLTKQEAKDQGLQPLEFMPLML